MKSDLIVYRPIAFASVLYKCIALVGSVAIFRWIGFDLAQSLMGAFCFFLAAVLPLQWTLTRRHRRGLKHVKAGHFEEAIHEYEKALAFFTRHVWLDRYRHLLLYGTGRMSQRETAMASIAYCNLQLGYVEAAKDIYRQILTGYPHNTLARQSLRFIEIVQNPRD